MASKPTSTLVVVGGGPAGYVGAIRAAQLGLDVVCVEQEALGGVCLNWGCIPTKALLSAAELYSRMKHEAESWGLLADDVRHDWQTVIARSRSVATPLGRGIKGLLRKHGVRHIPGVATIRKVEGDLFVDVKIPAEDTPLVLPCQNVLAATGARPRALPGVAFDGKAVLGVREAISLPIQPERLLIIGAGAIGMELACFYNTFDTHVTVVEMLDRVLPNEDSEVSKVVAAACAGAGIDCLTSTVVQSVTRLPKGVRVELTSSSSGNDSGPDNAGSVLEAEHVLIAIGVQGNVENVFDPTLGIALEHGHIKVDRTTYSTNIEGIYAAGDVIGRPWLAHVASEEAIACVERLAGYDPTPINYEAIPSCTFCMPQVASIGQTEDALADKGKRAGTDYTVGKFPFQASGKAHAVGRTSGFVKILSDTRTGKVIGAHLVGDSVTELLAELGLALRLEATCDEIIATMHAHPTLGEAIHEAALDHLGRAIHI